MADTEKPKPRLPPVTLRTLFTGLPPLPLKEGPLQPMPPGPAPPLGFLQGPLNAGVEFLRGVLGDPFAAETRANLTGQLLSAAIPVVGGAKGARMALGEVVREGTKGGPVVGRVLKGGFYSRVDEAVGKVPAKGAHPNKVASLLQNNASKEELAYRQVPEFLAAQGNQTVTPEALRAHLEAHPAPFPEVTTLSAEGSVGKDLKAWLGTRGVPATPQEWTATSDELTRLAQQWQRNGDRAQADRYFRLSEQATEFAEGLDLGRGLGAGQPKYAQYQVPGGEQYRETLLTLPEQPHNPYEAFTTQMEKKYGGGYDTAALTPDEQTMQGMLWDRSQRTGSGMTESQFRSSHFDQPNVLVHTRANARTLPTGARGRFVEEVQSDWHQAGKQKGYARDTSAELAQLSSEWEAARRTMMASDGAESAAAQARMFDITDKMNALHDLAGGVPDAPFKEAWPDLGVKQQLIEAAHDPNAEWLGFTSGQTQAARYDLSKQVSRVEFDAGDRQLRAFDHSGREVVRETTDADRLADYIGKEGAQKLLSSTPSLHPEDQTPLYSLSGVDLQVGGEGMKYFYDQLLPRRLDKILQPLGGGPVERAGVRVPLGGGGSGPENSAPLGQAFFDVLGRAGTIEGRVPVGSNATLMSREELGAAFEQGALTPFHFPPAIQQRVMRGGVQEPIWMAKLTPELKQKIRDQGLPLLTLLGATALGDLVRRGEAQGGHAR